MQRSAADVLRRPSVDRMIQRLEMIPGDENAPQRLFSCPPPPCDIMAVCLTSGQGEF